MERRLHERYPANLDAIVSDIAVPQRTALGRIMDLSEGGACAEVPREFPVGAIVRVQIAECSLFGHVIYCRCQDQNYRIGIEIVRVLIGESNIARLLKTILAEAMHSTPGVTSY